MDRSEAQKNRSELIKKAVSKMLSLSKEVKEHEKRAHATRLIYKQAEMGFGDLPRSHKELEEKIASLINQDLNVVEKALELTGGNIDLGELGSRESYGFNATESFIAGIMNG